MARTTIGRIQKLIAESKRPLVIVGNGARGSDFMKLNIPIITTRLGLDLIPTDHRLFVGRPGLVSERVSHFAIQQADFILILGARLDTGFIGYEPKDWGRHATKVIVDIDKEELKKTPFGIKINMDTREFVTQLLPAKTTYPFHWLWRINEWKERYPLGTSGSYGYIQEISRLAKGDDVVVVDTSSAFHITAQVWKIKEGQRYITTGGISTMGYWPASIGAALASHRRVICITGDGCLQMNIQELATVVKHRLNIKIFLLNNNGYLLIRHTQRTHLDNRLIGEGPKSGLGFPNFKTIARGYGMPYTTSITTALKAKGPILCELKTPYWEKLEPRIASSKNSDGSFRNRPFEDLSPYLAEDELNLELL